MIDRFERKYFFLSNFYSDLPNGVAYDGMIFGNSEAAFQAAKVLDRSSRLRFLGMDPSTAKKEGRRVQLRDDWEDVKEQVMYDIVKSKFENNPNVRELLIATGEEELLEGNTWHDNVWGSCTCPRCQNVPGKNLLGKTLMRVREELK